MNLLKGSSWFRMKFRSSLIVVDMVVVVVPFRSQKVLES